MSGVVVSMPAVPAAIPVDSATAIEATDISIRGEIEIGNYQRGTRIQLRPRFSEALIGAGTGNATLFWEPTYLRIYPHQWNAAGKTFSYRLWQPGEVARTPAIAAITADAQLSFFYEVDVAQVPIYLPFEASLALYSTRTRAEMYDLFWDDRGAADDETFGGDRDEASKVTMRDALQELTQTRLVKGGQTRLLNVPAGCNEYSIIGQNPTGIALGYETIPKANSNVPQIFTAPGLRRYPCGGATVINLDATTVDVAKASGIVFWVRLR